MRFAFKFLAFIALLYISIWAGLAIYFGFAERHKDLLEDNLSAVFDRTVSVDKLETTWVGWSPSLRITGFKVASDIENQAALSFDSASLIISPVSLITLWPKITEVAIDRPSLEVVTLPDNKLQVGGLTLGSNNQRGVNRHRILSWLLNHQSAAWHDGEVRWRKTDGSEQVYSDISFVYQRQQQDREVKLTVAAPKGTITAKADARGDLLSSNDWDASVELMSGVAGRMLEPGDLSFQVKDGIGQFRLSSLNIDRIRDFLALSGLADKARWILDADVSGVLQDVDFNFTGALAEIRDWSLSASAKNISFKSLASLPALTNLSGDLVADSRQGSFDFTAVDSTFAWDKFYPESFPIEEAQGQFSWQRNEQGEYRVGLDRGRLKDPNLTIYDLKASMTFDQAQQEVSSLGELFTVDSIKDLTYDDGQVVVGKEREGPKPLSLDASAKFDVVDTSQLVNYLPRVSKLEKFSQWLVKSFKQGNMSNGVISYKGELGPSAMRLGLANLLIRADFDSVTIDYSPDYDWPPAERGEGVAELKNDLLTIVPKKLWLNGDEVTDGLLTIENIFSRDSRLKLNGKTSTTLKKGLAFLFQGPLVPRQKRPQNLPVDVLGGTVDIAVDLDLPLNRVKRIKVKGTSDIKNGSVMLPEGVPITDLNALLSFTERSVTSDEIVAQFLGGKTTAKLVTTDRTQPPKMQLRGKGRANLATLQPWVGEHLLTLFEGETDWQGTLDINGENLVVNGGSDLRGVQVNAPVPWGKQADKPASFELSMNLGGKTNQGNRPAQHLLVEYADILRAEFKEDLLPKQSTPAGTRKPSIFDRALIQFGNVDQKPLPEGVNFEITYPRLNVDDLMETVIELASYEPQSQSENTDFLDAMRSVQMNVQSAVMMSREFGRLQTTINTEDGFNWNGAIVGDNIAGDLTMKPRDEIGEYALQLNKLTIGPRGKESSVIAPVDTSLQPSEYPAISVVIDQLRMDGRSMGALDFKGKPVGQEWVIEKFALVHNGIRTSAAGKWVNTVQAGSKSAFDFETQIDEAEGVLTDMDFDGYIRKGRGTVGGTVSWEGAPHEFEYSRLDGKFDFFLKDGELVQVEPGGGKLLGLLNFNAIARRLIFDFRDIFASGLKFDRMRYRGLISNGEAILQDAFILTPAVFVRMEGTLNLDKELIDMDVHVSPELGGNLTLLSALANPTAGAVVFLTSQIFKDDMRRASFKSYQAKGTWEDFEMVEIDSEGNPVQSVPQTGSEKPQTQADNVTKE